MKKEVGLWIDHRKVVIVTVQDDVVVTRQFKSDMEKHVRFARGSHSKGQHEIVGSSSEDVRDRSFEDHLNSYYEAVIYLIRDADSILIFGPGEAKVELEKRLKRDELGGRIVGIETVDKMTNNQIKAKVRDYYLKE